MWNGLPYSSFRPSELKKAIGNFAERFSGYEQHDAQEFLRFFLDGLHEDLNRIRTKPKYYEIKDREGATDQEISDEYWQYYNERNSSTMSDLFCGQLQSQVVCQECQHRSVCFDVFWDISLPIPKRSTPNVRAKFFRKGSGVAPISIDECFQQYTSEENLTDEMAYYCSKCKTHRPVMKKISLYRTPQILVLHLKRFSFSIQRREKVSMPIQFPEKELILDDYLNAAGTQSCECCKSY